MADWMFSSRTLYNSRQKNTFYPLTGFVERARIEVKSDGLQKLLKHKNKHIFCLQLLLVGGILNALRCIAIKLG